METASRPTVQRHQVAPSMEVLSGLSHGAVTWCHAVLHPYITRYAIWCYVLLLSLYHLSVPTDAAHCGHLLSSGVTNLDANMHADV